MEIRLLAFGIAKSIVGSSPHVFELTADSTVNDLKAVLEKQYPRLQELASYMIAVNNEYGTADNLIHDGDEIAIIPPVSGG